MSSSSGDEYSMFRKHFPLHDAIEAGDMETLMRLLRPNSHSHSQNASVVAGMDVDDGEGKVKNKQEN